MRSRVVEARAPYRISNVVALAIIATLATLLILATPARARAQAEWNIGPFLGYSTIHGGHPASAGLQTSVLVGPVGLRVSGFSALDQPYATSATPTDLPRYGGDADLMLIFDFASRGGGVGLMPYVFAGQDVDATQRAREYFTGYPPSSPSIGLLKDGQLVYMLERWQIEGRPAQDIAEDLVEAFQKYC